jgi:hypothetical protein
MIFEDEEDEPSHDMELVMEDIDLGVKQLL